MSETSENADYGFWNLKVKEMGINADLNFLIPKVNVNYYDLVQPSIK